MSLSPLLASLQKEIETQARSYGLDFFQVIFEVLDYRKLNQVAAYGGFPTRYPHWRFGMEFEQLQKGYTFGLQRIYEMVINNDPCYAYLLECNADVDQKIVMAHVYAHCDFFKNNAWFSKTNRKMMDEMANHATRVRRYMDRHGVDKVENFIDICLSIENLIDPHSLFIVRERPGPEPAEPQRSARRLKSKEYMQDYINPPDVLKAEEEEARKQKAKIPELNFPERPEKDVLLFLIEHAPLRHWQRDILSIVRDEAYYFYPQAQTKVMNEGWASYWHSTIMTTKALAPSELIDYADHHSGTMATSGRRLNPYKLGIELLRDVEERWNTGRFGPEYDECDDLDVKRKWDKQLGLGRQKIFEVRRIHNDITFIDTFLTPEFCARHKMFSYAYAEPTQNYVIESREFDLIKQRLLFSLTNFGKPWIYVLNGNFRNRGELLLKHEHNGIDLKLNHARDVLVNVQSMWARPVHLETMIDGKATLLSFDGSEHTQKVIGETDDPRRNAPAKTR